jgi:hypothetical protein
MPIKNKDGSTFKLNGPNPLLKSQDIEVDDLIVHNQNPEETIGQDPSYYGREIPNPFQPKDIKSAVEEFMEIKEEPKPIEKPKIEEPPKVKEKSRVIDGKLIAWCLPAINDESYNNLYGESDKSLSYGEKFSFETVLIRRGMFGCDLWSPVKVEKNSILYLWEGREWWRVSKFEEYSDGWLLTCFPSDHHPSF